MNLAFVSNVVYPFVTGGAEKRIYEIGTRLTDKGHEVTVYGRHFWDGPEKIVHKGMNLQAVSPERELYVEKDGRRSITEALEFAKDIIVPLRRNISDHDVVVVSVFPYFPVVASKLALFAQDTPLVTTWHEVWGSYWEEYLGHLAPFGKVVEQLTSRVPQYPIAVSEVTAKRLAEIGPDRNHIRTVSNGVDFNRIRNTPPAENGFDVLFAGRLIEDKRVDILLKAFNQSTPIGATLGIIGDGPERRALELLSENLDRSEDVTFLGFLEEYDRVLGHMRAADIFVSPSTREGFGITAVEAMAAGCIVIGARHPGSAVSEVVSDAGFLVEPEVGSVASILSRALSGERPPVNPQTRAKRFDWDSVTEDALQAYSAAANRQ